jgi:phosphoglycolate phosphatase
MSLEKLLGKPPKALLFDLDGTLIDSAPDLANAIDLMLVEMGFSAVSESKVRPWVGNGARKLVERALTFSQKNPCSESSLDTALAIFFKHYQHVLTDNTRLYSGVKEALQFWHAQGIAMACVTNKPARFTAPLLAHFALDRFMPIAISGDTLPVKKPQPQPLWRACELLGVSSHDVIMVGDSSNDVEAARNAGMLVICVSYGYNHGEPIQNSEPDWLVDSLEECLF